MEEWRRWSGTLCLRRLELPAAAGLLADLHIPTAVGLIDGVLVLLSASMGMSADAQVKLQTLVDMLASDAASASPTDALARIRDGLRAALEAGTFERALPDVMAAVVDPAFGLRMWRAGPNGFGSSGKSGVRLVSEDLRFAALRRRGAVLQGPPRDPLIEEISALLQLDPPHDTAQRLAVRMEGGCILLLSRGAVPFDAPAVGEEASAFWARDAGWRHGLGATVVAIANEGSQPAADLAMDTLEEALVSARRVGRADGNILLRALHRAARRIAEGSDAERVAAARWAAAHPDGRGLLEFVASDEEARADAREAAIDALESVGIVGAAEGRTVSPTERVDVSYMVARTSILDAARTRDGLAAVIMETGYPEGAHTLACTEDGGVQILFSSGLLETAWGHHASVRDAASAFFRLAATQTAARVTWDLRLPAEGVVRFLLVGNGVVRALDAIEERTRHDEDPSSELYHAAHAVLTAARVIEEGSGADAAARVEVTAHVLFDHDPQGELELLEGLQAEAAEYIPKVRRRLGSAFRDALRIVGYRVALGRGQREIAAALRTVIELGVALFRRGEVGPDVTVRLTVLGEAVHVAGGVDDAYSPPNWIAATSAAMVLRDRAAIESLCRVNPAAFEGASDAYFSLHARALMALHRGDATAVALFGEALSAAEHASSFPELGQRVAAPCLRAMLAVLASDADGYRKCLVEGLDAYRSVYQRPDLNHEAANLMPLRYVAIAAFAYDRGLPCPVQSEYVPLWLVEGSSGDDAGTTRVASRLAEGRIERLRDVRIDDARYAGRSVALSLERVDLRGASLAGAHPSIWALRCRFDDVDATLARWPHARFQECSAHRARFDGTDLTAADMKALEAEGASFAGVVAEGVDLSGSKLAGCSFAGANLRGARFEGADLRNVDLRGADLRGGWLVDADLRGANSEGVLLEGAELRGAKGVAAR